MSQVAVPADEFRLTDIRRRLKAMLIRSIGNLVEWYDFYAYTAFALYFADSFFPGDDPVLQQLNAAILFAIGFVMRPIGGSLPHVRYCRCVGCGAFHARHQALFTAQPSQ